MHFRSVAGSYGRWTTEADLYYTQVRKFNLKSFGVKVCTVYTRTYIQRHFHGFQEFDIKRRLLLPFATGTSGN
jgi:hypothetical protein